MKKKKIAVLHPSRAIVQSSSYLFLSIRSNSLPGEILQQVKCFGRLRSLEGQMAGQCKRQIQQYGRLNYLAGQNNWQFKMSVNSNCLVIQSVWQC